MPRRSRHRQRAAHASKLARKNALARSKPNRTGSLLPWPWLARMPWTLLLTVLFCFMGFALLYSAAGSQWSPWALSQLVRSIPGFAGMLIIAFIPTGWLMAASLPFYLLSLGLLAVVEVVGFVGMGAQRWIDLGFFVLQPSEPAKLALILMLARYFHRLNYEHLGRMVTVMPPVGLILLPFGLILIQPNLGTAGITLLIGVAMLFAGGVRLWKFMVVGGVAAAAAPIGWSFMHDYQKQRVMTFMNPEADPLGSGYNIMQSKIAIGSGGLEGRGFGQGPQGQLNFLPEKHTDFIYTLLAEEFGFIGSVSLVAAYVLLLGLGFKIALSCQHHYGRMLAFGVVTYFFLHIFINMAMVMGMVPVVGVPLPFLSYGGTQLITNLLAIGLLMHVHVHRNVTLPRATAYG